MDQWAGQNTASIVKSRHRFLETRKATWPEGFLQISHCWFMYYMTKSRMDYGARGQNLLVSNENTNLQDQM